MRPVEKAGSRDLPQRRNPVLKDPPSLQELIENRRLSQTTLGEKHIGGPFSYVHLRVALPQPLDEQELFGTGPRESYFLMRRSKDGFISATGMFKATFPWARKSEEDIEKQYVKTHFKNTSKEETAGNLWVDPNDALQLADDYGIRPWIDALVDNEPVIPADHRKRSITPPPPFFRGVESDALSSASPGSTRRRSTRSMSPGKRIITPRKSRISKATAARDNLLKKGVTPIVETEEFATTTTRQEKVLAPPVLTNGNIVVLNSGPSAKKESPVKIEVDEAVKTEGDTEVTTTHVKVEMPHGPSVCSPSRETTEDMIAKAREMVAEARKREGESPPHFKRKSDDIDQYDDDYIDNSGLEEQTPEERRLKRSKLLETELRREKVKNRALLGLSATLALGALLPYVL